MMCSTILSLCRLRLLASVVSMAVVFSNPMAANAQVSSFSQALAEAASSDEDIADYYRNRAYAPLWTGPDDVTRRAALLAALSDAPLHGLPTVHYDAAVLAGQFRSAVTEGDRGRLEVAMTAAFLAYAHDLQTGVLEPTKVDAGILRQIARRDPATLLTAVEVPDPRVFLRNLAPQDFEYAQLMKEKLRLEDELGAGGWGQTVGIENLDPGDSGPKVVALRDRLIALGYLGRSVSQVYDSQIAAAVQRFQLDQGLNADGVAGASTIDALNETPQTRLKSIVVAMERLRWMAGTDRSGRYIWVNQPDFTAKIFDDGRTTFKTRVVIGKDVLDQRSPEFSDQMEYMVINPSWGVPRSIIVKEYLPLLQRNPGAVGHLQVIDGNGRVVPRGAINFAAYSARSFPYGLRQPPSDGNALGKVKFMFPNPQNIYLHDTPTKSLFSNEVRAYSHGCIRLADPLDFAYTLLARQSTDPQSEFKTHLDTGLETNVTLEQNIPVHLVYFTAWPSAKGSITYRRDVYGRDSRIFDALTEAGVVLKGVQG